MVKNLEACLEENTSAANEGSRDYKQNVQIWRTQSCRSTIHGLSSILEPVMSVQMELTTRSLSTCLLSSGRKCHSRTRTKSVFAKFQISDYASLRFQWTFVEHRQPSDYRRPTSHDFPRLNRQKRDASWLWILFGTVLCNYRIFEVHLPAISKRCWG